MAAAQATGVFDPNEFYRITNLALGGEYSLDVDNSKDIPDGKLGMAASGLYEGQLYQVLENPDKPGHYWFASLWLGAKMKMDAVLNDKRDFAPFLMNYTTQYRQTWGLTNHTDVLNNRTTWTIMPDWFGGVGTSLAMSVYSDTKQPYLAVPGPNPDLGTGDVNQAWFITKEDVTIDDPSYSITNLPALATAVPTLPDGVTQPATATPTSTSESEGSSETDHLAGPLIAAAVVPTVTVFLSVLAFIAFICLRRRTARRMARNMPYGRGSAAAASKDGFASEILCTFSAETLGHWRRRSSSKERGNPFSQSVASSHLSEPRLQRLPEDSAASINPHSHPLRPPPLRTPSNNRVPQHDGRPNFFGSSALGLSDTDTTLTSQHLYHMQIEELSGVSPARKPPWMEERSPSVMEGKGMEVLLGEMRNHEHRRGRNDRPRSLFELENTRPASRYELE